jgi:hypothetical protein
MSEQDPQAFQELFDSEPTNASPSEAATWVGVYERLIAMMERQLEETRQFAETVHEPMRQYLSKENMNILEGEIGAFKQRLVHWSERGDTSS